MPLPPFSAFDINQHQDDVASKTVVALEKVAEIFRVSLWEKAKAHGRSPLQIQLLIFIQFHPSEKCKVTYLSEEFNMTKPTISDAIKVLIQKGYLIKEQEVEDKRSFYYLLTPAGKALAEEFAFFTQPLRQIIANWQQPQQDTFYRQLLQLIQQAQQQDLVHLQRMCLNCQHYRQQGNRHYCNFIEKNLADAELRIDCPDFEKK